MSKQGRLTGDQTFDVAVVGGGPAGLSVARTVASHGFSVALVDENPHLGGQYFKQRTGAVLDQLGPHRPLGRQLIEDVQSAGVSCFTETVVWGIDESRALLTSHARSATAAMRITARAIVVATGAQERTMPVPGWHLPGVMSAGNALHLAAVNGVPPGRQVLIAGTGPFLLQVADEVARAGSQVMGVVEYNRPYTPSFASIKAVENPARIKEFLAYRLEMARRRIPLEQHTAVRSVVASGSRLAATLERLGSAEPRTEVTVDAVIFGWGFQPSIELVRLLGADLRRDSHDGMWIPAIDQNFATTTTGVYAVGEVAGVAGVHAALARGRIAGRAIVRALKSTRADVSDGDDARDRRLLARTERFATFVKNLYPFPTHELRDLPESTLVCRCEGVPASAVRCVDTWATTDPNAVKGETRAGMGPCQGRECAAVIQLILGNDASPPQTPRMPLRPIRTSTVAAMHSDLTEAP